MPIRKLLGCVAAFSAAVAVAAPGFALAAGDPARPELDRPATPDRQAVPQAPGPGGSLSERLNRSNGVIRPPASVDPEVVAPTPPAGPQSTPVIPPPGTPGSGQRKVQPK